MKGGKYGLKGEIYPKSHIPRGEKQPSLYFPGGNQS